MLDECELAESEAVAASVDPEPLPPLPVPVEKPPKEPKPPKPKREPPPPLPELPPLVESKLTFTKRVRKEGRENEVGLWRQARSEELRSLGHRVTKERVWHEAILHFTPIVVEKSRWTPPKVDVGNKLAKLPALKDAATRDEALLWVMNHPAMVREPIGPHAKIYLEKSDIDGCPNQAAWWLLSKSINNQDAFAKDAFTLLGKMGSGKEKDAKDEGSSGLGEMTEMLARLGDA